MPSTNPLTSSIGKLRDAAVGALKDPKGTTEQVIGQVKGAASLGRSVAEGVASQVTARIPGRPKRAVTPAGHSAPARPMPTGEPRPHGDANAPAGSESRPATAPPAKKAAAKKAPAKKKTSKDGTTAKKAPSKKAAVTEPALHGGAQDEVVYTTETSGRPASPDDAPPPPQPGEDSLIDPGTAKQIAKEAERGRRDAEPL